ncbi:MAG: hypothetical protein ACREM9_13350, partial [Gemmatimonadales bacterium]
MPAPATEVAGDAGDAAPELPPNTWAPPGAGAWADRLLGQADVRSRRTIVRYASQLAELGEADLDELGRRRQLMSLLEQGHTPREALTALGLDRST